MRKFREMIFSSGNKGFTLIELLVVIAVLGILAGIAVPRILGVRDQAESGALKANANTFSNAMEMHFARYGYYPAVPEQSLGALPNTTFGDLKITFSSDTDATISHEDSGAVDENTSGASYVITLTDSENNTITVSDGGISEVTIN